jgi:hypothetical protein
LVKAVPQKYMAAGERLIECQAKSGGGLSSAGQIELINVQ